MFDKGTIGLYLGNKGLSIVETVGGKIKNYLYSPYPKDLTAPAGVVSTKESIFDAFLNNQIEIIAFIQKTIRDSRVGDNEIVACISNSDLIVRFFELPPIPRKEIENTIGLEIKKYIPFKTEEITYDYQLREKQKITEVLFTGIKKDDLTKYSSLLEQLNLKISIIEPAQFSILRLLKTHKKISDKESVVVVELDGAEGVVVILDAGIPCFVRDIRLTSGLDQENDMENLTFRIINEVRVSLDYYRRQFSRKGVDKIIILSKQETGELINTFSKELGINVFSLNPKDILGLKEEYGLDLAKAMGASLRSKSSFYSINLIKTKNPVKSSDLTRFIPALGIDFNMVTDYLNIAKNTIILGVVGVLLTLGVVFSYANSKIAEVNQKLNNVYKEADVRITQELRKSTLEEMGNLKSQLISKLGVCDNVFKQTFYLSEKLEVLPKLIPQGVWLTKLYFEKNKRNIYLEGMVYNNDDKVAKQLTYDFVSNLKNSPLFFNKIQNIAMRNLTTTIVKKYKVVAFQIDIVLTEDVNSDR